MMLSLVSHRFILAFWGKMKSLTRLSGWDWLRSQTSDSFGFTHVYLRVGRFPVHFVDFVPTVSSSILAMFFVSRPHCILFEKCPRVVSSSICLNLLNIFMLCLGASLVQV
jgi:hypothetical protein